ncbi:50S ribosomal protein L10 [Patescibacteria group bacterium]|nr:50S ribosomal protein L10 [Patescibacteria group bacterium]MBU1683772.1 50S ribosomal protein L10 [Patescibacteria group bacterium]MBU1934755.1 50S ribosomal protein L10 [Patescibacteria group bacterium]
MPITKQKKEEILQELIDKFSRSKSVVFVDYRGLDVASISDLRRKLRENDTEMKIAKKTLIGLAAKDQKIDSLDGAGMEGPVAATFSYEDPFSGIKALFEFSKTNNNLKLLGGIIDGKVVGPDVVERYAKLPSKEELLAKFIGSMNSPVSGFVGLLGNLLGGFVRVLSAYKDTLPAEEAKAEPKAETKEEKPEEPADEASVEATVGTRDLASKEGEEEKPEEPTEEEK